jgi:hypothetical protein
MKTSFRKKYNKNSRKVRKSKKYLKKYRKTMKNLARGSYKCCMCNKKFNSKLPLTPSKCGRKLSVNSHKICPDCWWNKFAIEGANHKCPGCPPEHKKNKSSGTPEIIDLISSISTS